MGKERIRSRVRVKAQRDGTVVDVPHKDHLLSAGQRRLLLILPLLAVGIAAAVWFALPSPEALPPTPDGMVWIAPCQFNMGSSEPGHTDAVPVHAVTLSGYWIDINEVTNAEFQKFVEATGHVTAAEKSPEYSEYENLPPEMLLPSSMVFVAQPGGAGNENVLQSWKSIKGANWRHPEGPQSNIQGREQHPVVHVSYKDALAYATWAGKSMPTEAQWECAARGGLDRARYCWGNELKPTRQWAANVWQGEFPTVNTVEDGFAGTAPVGSFPPNGFGLHDMSGNVVELCADWYRPDYYAESPARNPLGPRTSADGSKPIVRRVQRGGSFLSPAGESPVFTPGARGRGDPRVPSNHLGFRCVKNP